jgi:hypothetical protein
MDKHKITLQITKGCLEKWFLHPGVHISGSTYIGQTKLTLSAKSKSQTLTTLSCLIGAPGRSQAPEGKLQ